MEPKEREELYSIMRDFLEVEYNQKSLLYLLKSVETIFVDEEAKLIVNGTKCYLRALQGELKAAINRMDSYIAENVKKSLF